MKDYNTLNYLIFSEVGTEIMDSGQLTRVGFTTLGQDTKVAPRTTSCETAAETERLLTTLVEERSLPLSKAPEVFTGHQPTPGFHRWTPPGEEPCGGVRKA